MSAQRPTTRSAVAPTVHLLATLLGKAHAALDAAEKEASRWLAWSRGCYPDDSPGDVIAWDADGSITLDDGVTTWNPLRALAAAEKERERDCQVLRDNHATEIRNLREEVEQERAARRKREPPRMEQPR